MCNEALNRVHIRVDRYFRDAFIVSELVFDVLNDFSRVLSVSRDMLNRIPYGFFISFFPGPHLRVTCTHRAFRVIRIVAKRENMLSLSPLANQVKSFPEIFSTFQIAACGKKRLSVKVATGKCGVVHDIKGMQQVVPLVTRETAFC